MMMGWPMPYETPPRDEARVIHFPDDGDAPGWRRPVLALGNFDGMHRGHAKIMQHVRRRADEQGATAVGIQRGQRGHWDRKVGMSVARAVVWGEEDYVFVAGSRRVQLVVVDVEMLEGMAMAFPGCVQEQVPMGRVALGKVMVQHRPQS